MSVLSIDTTDQQHDQFRTNWSFFANLKVRTKVILGFCSVLALLVAVVGAGLFAFQQAADSTADLVQSVRVADNARDIENGFSELRRNVDQFGVTNDLRYRDGIAMALYNIKESVDRALSASSAAAIQQMFRDISGQLDKYADRSKELQTALEEEGGLVTSKLTPTIKDVESGLEDLIKVCNDYCDKDASEYLVGGFISLNKAIVAATRLNFIYEESAADLGRKSIAQFIASLEKIATLAYGTEAKSKIKTMVEKTSRLRADFDRLAELRLQVDTLTNKTMAAAANDIAANSKTIRDRAAARQTAISERTEEIVGNTRIVLAGLGLGGCAVGLLLAWLVGGAISRPIAAMTAAMSRLADRDWSVVVPLRGRRDELGDMASAVQTFKANGIEADRLAAEAEATRAAQADLQRQHEAQERANAEALRRQEEEARTAEEARRRDAEAAERRLAEERRTAEESQRAATEAQRKRELSELAKAFENSVGSVVGAVSQAASEMQETARTMTGIADETAGQSQEAGAATEVSATNVQTVSAATEELSASIQEISGQVANASRVAQSAVDEARRTDEIVRSLAAAADRIGAVVQLINDIAGQTNLLALNATIEAARAGEAGKGFAVVASEVKSLANQTAKATEEISQQIAGVQGSTAEAVEAIRHIGGTIEKINEISSSIASAVEEQGAATREIARNVDEASSSTRRASDSVSRVARAASESGQTAGQVLHAATDLSQQADRLRGEIEGFLAQIRAA